MEKKKKENRERRRKDKKESKERKKQAARRYDIQNIQINTQSNIFLTLINLPQALSFSHNLIARSLSLLPSFLQFFSLPPNFCFEKSTSDAQDLILRRTLHRYLCVCYSVQRVSNRMKNASARRVCSVQGETREGVDAGEKSGGRGGEKRNRFPCILKGVFSQKMLQLPSRRKILPSFFLMFFFLLLLWVRSDTFFSIHVKEE